MHGSASVKPTHILHNVYINTCQLITQQSILYTIKIVYCQDDMFRPLLGHLQALWENRSKSYLYFNALWDPKCLQTVLYECEINKFVYIGMCVIRCIYITLRDGKH